jgi:hypothetical protein
VARQRHRRSRNNKPLRLLLRLRPLQNLRRRWLAEAGVARVDRLQQERHRRNRILTMTTKSSLRALLAAVAVG